MGDIGNDQHISKKRKITIKTKNSMILFTKIMKRCDIFKEFSDTHSVEELYIMFHYFEIDPNVVFNFYFSTFINVNISQETLLTLIVSLYHLKSKDLMEKIFWYKFFGYDPDLLIEGDLRSMYNSCIVKDKNDILCVNIK